MPGGKVLDRRPIPNGYVSPGNSPFLKKHPREIRDKIYDELLIVHMTPEDWEKYEDVKNHDRASDFARECVFDDFDQEYALMPNVKINEQNNKGTRYIARNKGILLANKQIYQEATSVLFGKNLWGAIPEFERIWSFWRCDSYKCQPVERPCYVRPETAANIKHLLIIVNVRGLPAESHNLKRNLYMMVDTLKGIGIQLQTLKVRYWTQYGGEVEALREDLEGPLPPGIPPRPIMMKNFTTGRYDMVRRSEINTKLFRDINILEPLRRLKGVAQEASIRGDLPQAYKDELTKVLTSATPTCATKKKLQEKAAAERKRQAASTPSPSLAEFARDMLAKDPNADAGMRGLYQQLMRTSVKSPAVMAELFKEPTKEEIDRISAQCRADRVARDAEVEGQGASEGEVEEQVSLSGIGVIAGKPIFGPPRPPGMA